MQTLRNYNSILDSIFIDRQKRLLPAWKTFGRLTRDRLVVVMPVAQHFERMQV